MLIVLEIVIILVVKVIKRYRKIENPIQNDSVKLLIAF